MRLGGYQSPSITTGRLWLFFVVASTVVSQCSAGCCAPADAAPARKPENFAILVDTSGSMVGLYQRRDPRPTLVLELVQSLITETMQKGDRLVVLPFDRQVHNAPGDFVAISSLNPGTALAEIEKLGLRPQSGYGTARSAAIGAGVKAMQALESSGRFSGGVLFVVTDTDNDAAPDGAAKTDYDRALSLQRKGDLKLLSRIPQGGIRLEVWRVQGSPGTAPPTGPQAAIDKVRRLLRDIIPVRLTTGPIASDMEQGGLSLQPTGEWSPGKDGALTLPLKIASRYRVLHFNGKLQSQTKVLDATGKEILGTSAKLEPVQLRLAPGAATQSTLKITGLPRAGLLTISPLQPRVQAGFKTSGVITTAAKLFDAPDPRTSARVSGATWIENFSPPLATSSLPKPPASNPPRALQAVCLVVLLGLLAGGWKLLGPKPVPPLTLHYWIEGEAIAKRVALNGRDASFPLSGISVTAQRRGVEKAVVLRAMSNAALVDSSQNEQSELAFTGGGRVLVKGASGRLTAMNFDSDKAPPRPEAAKQNDATDEFVLDSVPPSSTTSEMPSAPPSSAAPSRKGDEWGLG
jgi:hypothetical protein